MGTYQADAGRHGPGRVAGAQRVNTRFGRGVPVASIRALPSVRSTGVKAWGRVAAAAVAASLTLAACSGHKSKTANVHLNNTDNPTTSGPKKKTSLTSGGPAFNFPADLTVDFDNWVSTGDTTKDKVLSDYSILLKAVVMAQVNPDNPDRTWLQYVTVTGQPGFATFLASRKTKSLTVTGTETYRNPKVTSVQGTTAQVTMCQDDTKLLD